MTCHSFLYVLWWAVMLGSRAHCNVTDPLYGAYAPGDVVIGILTSVHNYIEGLQDWVVPDLSACIDLDLITFIQSLAAIHNIEMINDSGFLPGIRLGYVICDSCACATKALHCVEHMLAVNMSLPVLLDYSNFSPPVKAFLGERYTETSIPMAKLLSLYRIPQISCTSSAAALSDKSRYASFFRVIPSNVHQAEAVAKLLLHFKWSYIGVITVDDEYGKGFLENFLRYTGETICVHFQKELPTKFNQTHIEDLADSIQLTPKVSVVLLILRVQQVEMLFREMIKRHISRTWIATNTWSMARFVMKMKDINKVGEVIGTNFVTGNIPGFKDYLQNLKPGPGARNDFIREYKQLRFNCSSSQQSQHKSPLACNVTDPQEANDDYLLQTVDPTEVYNQRVAVYAVANALKNILQCNNTVCSGDTNFMPWKLVDILRKINFTLDNQTYFFNKDGNFENGYDIIIWKGNGDEKTSEVVGRFTIKKGELEVYEHNISWPNNTVSSCFESCRPGTEKNSDSNISCCYSCTDCKEGTYNNEWNQSTCQTCPNGTSSYPGSSACQKWKIAFLEWSSAQSIVVMVGTALGALLLLFSLVVFILNKGDKHIQDIFIISCLMKFGLLVSFGSVIVFLGDPNIHLCRAQQLMYGLGYTLCISCILVKAFHTFLGVMSYNPDKKRKWSKCDKPPFIIALCIVPQVLICTFWMIFDRVDIKDTPSTTDLLTKNRLCTQGSMYGFGAMHIYIALIAVICFGLALKGKDEETEPVIFSMLIHLFAWFCFIPIFITQYESRPIVQLSAIMVFNYGVIFCHFTPKWVKVLSKKPKNPPQPPLSIEDQDDGDSGYNPTLSPSPTLIRSVSQGRFSFTESEPSNQDNNSLHMSEFRVSIRHRRITSIRRRSL